MPTSGRAADTRPYHHGDLRRALVAAGAGIVAEHGAANLSLREVARQLGVSHNAPYKHFATREALLAAIAAQGYVELADRLSEAQAEAEDPMAGRALAYVGFALEQPAVFRLMFSDAIDRSAFPELQAAQARSYERFQAAISEAYGPELLNDVTLSAWAFVHGLAMLLLDGQAAAMGDDRDPLDIARAVVAVNSKALLGMA